MGLCRDVVCLPQGENSGAVQLRLAALHALNRAPRDPRFWQPLRELRWVSSTSASGRFIPEHGVHSAFGCIGQVEEHVRRPTSEIGPGFVKVRSHFGRRTTPLISYNSVGWNRRHYEPLPDISWMPTPRAVIGEAERASPLLRVPQRLDARLRLSDLYDARGSEPPRVVGIDTESRPPLVLHSRGKIRRTPVIGTHY